jgi:hypothetical protein
MIKDSKKLREFEKKYTASRPIRVEENFRIVEALYMEARDLGVFPLKDPLDGIEDKIRMALAVNHVS